jgi:glycerate-2-kinase
VNSQGAVRALLEQLFRQAIAAVDPASALRRAVTGDGSDLSIAGEPVPPEAKLVVLAVGKAAGAMAAALEERVGDRLRAGLAITADGHGVPLAGIALREAAHPVPDARGEDAAREAVALVASAAPEDILVVLLSGGASSLMPSPAPGLTLADLAATTGLLLAGGADIEELNAVRKHLSAVAGGRLALRAASRRIEVLALSDVPGDRIDVIGSGPFAADASSYGDALAAIDRCGVREQLPDAVLNHLEAGARGAVDETPKPLDPGLDRVRTTLLATNRTAVAAARAAATRAGMRAPDWAGTLRGEARVAGRRLAELACALRPRDPMCLVAGGETVVTVRGPGRGGRSQELALAAAIALEDRDGAALLAAGTDGTDGPTDAAGAYADGGTVARGRARGVDARTALDANDSHGFFALEGGLLRTGPTRTNVMDLALLHVAPPR